MKTDIEILIKKYKGLWVALEPESQTVVSSGKSATTAYKKAKDKGIDIPTLFKVPSRYVPNIG